MATYFVEGLETTTQTLLDGDELFLVSGGRFNTVADAIQASGQTDIFVGGEIVSAENAIELNGGTHRINIARPG